MGPKKNATMAGTGAKRAKKCHVFDDAFGLAAIAEAEAAEAAANEAIAKAEAAEARAAAAIAVAEAKAARAKAALEQANAAKARASLDHVKVRFIF